MRFLEEPVSVERRLTTIRSRRDGLSVAEVPDVSRHKDAGYVGLGLVLHDDIAVLVEVELPFEDLRVWVIPDCNEEAVELHHLLFAGLDVPDFQSLHPLL